MMLGLLETLKIKDPCLGLDLIQGKSNEDKLVFTPSGDDVVCVCGRERENGANYLISDGNVPSHPHPLLSRYKPVRTIHELFI